MSDIINSMMTFVSPGEACLEKERNVRQEEETLELSIGVTWKSMLEKLLALFAFAATLIH